MKKYRLLFFVLIGLVFSCEDTTENIFTSEETATVQEIDMSDFYVRTDENTSSITDKNGSNNGNTQKCYSMQVLNRQLDENPGLYKRMYAVEKHTRAYIAAKKPKGTPGGGNGNNGGNDGDDDGDTTPNQYPLITIPVNVNIIESFADEIPDSQVENQIGILNDDFSNMNPNKPVDGPFLSFRANINIQFELKLIRRKSDSKKNNWTPDDSMKYSSQEGIDVLDPETHLNIWVVNNIVSGNSTILGYAQFPGGNSDTDGIVIGSDFFGMNSKGGTYGFGRTATHEVGHWLNLRHIWGDGRCNRDDFVNDTPRSDRPNYGCPGNVNHCRSRDMTMNYMDYVYDNCMYMFTHGQNDRMHAIFESGGARESFVSLP